MLKIAIIGFGMQGIEHAKWINQNDGLKLIAICENNESRVGEIKNSYKVDVVTNFDEILDRKDIDYVVISTTNEFHEEYAIRALNKKKNVIVEKPMSMNYEGAQRMVKAAEINNKKLFVFHSTSWDRDFLLVKRIVNSNKLGKILSIQSRVIEFGEFWAGCGIDGMKNPWRIKKPFGGMIGDWAPHLIEQLFLLTGKDPIGVYAITQCGIWRNEVEDHFIANIKYDNDLICQIEASNNCRLPLPRWFIIGEKGTFSMKSTLTNIWEEAEINYTTDDGEKLNEYFRLTDNVGAGLSGGFYKDLIPFLKGEKLEFVDIRRSLKGVKIIDAIRKSASENCYINLSY